MSWHIPAVQPYRSPTLEHASDTKTPPCQLACVARHKCSLCIRGVYNTLGAFSKHSLRAEAQIYLSHPIHTVRWHWGVSGRDLNHFSVGKYRVCSLRYYPRCNFSLRMGTKKANVLKPHPGVNHPTQSVSPGII